MKHTLKENRDFRRLYHRGRSAVSDCLVVYAMRNECCGGYTTIENRAYASKQAQKIADSAKAQGAELLITACPLCLYNLSQNTDGTLPVRYFAELLAEALGVGEDAE